MPNELHKKIGANRVRHWRERKLKKSHLFTSASPRAVLERRYDKVRTRRRGEAAAVQDGGVASVLPSKCARRVARRCVQVRFEIQIAHLSTCSPRFAHVAHGGARPENRTGHALLGAHTNQHIVYIVFACATRSARSGRVVGGVVHVAAVFSSAIDCLSSLEAANIVLHLPRALVASIVFNAFMLFVCVGAIVVPC